MEWEGIKTAVEMDRVVYIAPSEFFDARPPVKRITSDEPISKAEPIDRVTVPSFMPFESLTFSSADARHQSKKNTHDMGTVIITECTQVFTIHLHDRGAPSNTRHIVV
jgi:hypothetical protein